METLPSLIPEGAREICATNLPDTQLLSNFQIKEYLEAAFKSCLIQIALVSSENLDEQHQEEVQTARLHSADQLRKIYDSFADLQLNPNALRSVINSMNSTVLGATVVSNRLAAVEAERNRMGKKDICKRFAGARDPDDGCVWRHCWHQQGFPRPAVLPD